YQRIQSFDNALEDYKLAVKLYPDDDEARYQLADMLLDYSRLPREAIVHFNILINHDPADKTYLLGRARCWRELGETDKAEEALNQLVKANPNFAYALLERGQLALVKGDAAEALTWLRRAVDLAPFDYRSNSALQTALGQSGKSEEALLQKKKSEAIFQD